tara:strand:+ start:38270 stop:39010 length:741 start_codon:yes stop_codon:yes gene_type:complete
MTDIVFGVHACVSMMSHAPENILQLWVQQAPSSRLNEIIQDAKNLGIPVQTVSKKVLDKKTQEQSHQGILLEIKSVEVKSETHLKHDLSHIAEGHKPGFYLILDGIQDPHNLGAIIRSAEAFGVQGLILPKSNSVGITPTVRKIACGAELGLAIYQVANLARSIEILKSNGIWVVGTMMDAPQTLYQCDLKRSIALVMGNEQKGLKSLTQKNCDEFVTIPLSGHTASLNVSVATGICISEVARQRG